MADATRTRCNECGTVWVGRKPMILTALKAATEALTDAAHAIYVAADYTPTASADKANGDAYREAGYAIKAARKAQRTA